MIIRTQKQYDISKTKLRTDVYITQTSEGQLNILLLNIKELLIN